MQGEKEVEAFDNFKFSERIVAYLRSRIDEVLTCVSSKRTKIWSDFHQIRLDKTGLLHRKLLDNLNENSADTCYHSLFMMKFILWLLQSISACTLQIARKIYSRGPGLCLYALYLGEDNSIVLD